MTKRIGSGLLAVGCALLVAGCSAADTSEEQVTSSQTEALAFGIQGFAQFDASGHTLPGTVTTTIGTTIDATHSATGTYQVTFHFLAAFSPTVAGQGGTVQISAVGPGNSHCTLSSPWTYTGDHSVVAKVVCRAPGGLSSDTGFLAYFGRGPASSGRSVYALVNADASVPSATSYSSSGAAISASHPGVGAYWVFMSAEDRQEVQVTALATTRHCHASLREFGVTTVLCFDDAGVPADAAFTLNQAGTNGLPIAGVGAFAQVGPSGALDSRYVFNACPLGTTTASRVGLGRYTVSHTLVAEGLQSYQLSAYDNSSGYCKVDNITAPGASTTATVTAQCYSAAGTPADLGFVESYAVYIGDCGGCPHSCQGGACVLGVCQPVTLASGLAPRSVGANASTVYFSNTPALVASGAMMLSVPRTGGTPTTLVTLASAGHVANVDSVLVGPSYVYWFESGNMSPGVYRKPLTSGSRSLFAAGGQDPQPRALSLIGSNLYFANAFQSQLYVISSSGVRTPLLPAMPPPGSVNYYPFNLATDSVRAYFTRDTGGSVLSVPLSGGVPTTIASVTPTVSSSGLTTSAIATDGSNVYFATSVAPGNIFKVPAAGGTTSTFAVTSGVVTGIAIQSGTLYWTVKSPGAVMSQPLSGGPAQTVASGESSPGSIFVDANSVIWTTTDSVRMIAR